MQVMQDSESILKKLKPLGYRPTKYVIYYNGCNVNNFKFHMQPHEEHKSTMNSGVCVKGSWFDTKAKSDYYGIIEEVIKLTYPLGDNSVILFKY